jgi:hypothetical protein
MHEATKRSLYYRGYLLFEGLYASRGPFACFAAAAAAVTTAATVAVIRRFLVLRGSYA